MVVLGLFSDRYLVPLFNKLSSPKHYYRMTGKWLPYLWVITLTLMVYGLYGGFTAPAEKYQGEVYRIIYIHVPLAWLSMMAYMVMAVAAFVSIVWRIKMADVVLISCAPIGAIFTFLALVTGAVWGYPTWGTWWTWDLRLTSELVLLFIYLGIIALYSTYEDKRTASRAVAVLTLVCVVNIPIIHYSIQWLGDKTLHQANSVSVGKSSMDVSMLIPLLVMSFAFKFLFAAIVIMRSRSEVLLRESNSRWVEGVLGVEK
ncbi:MAG: cytochrome c biogenesis protein CcsA [Methylococcales bacterium]|nr:cytochrome c biogenesis protein CcsA [Methylococcales bacterium]MBT7442843.1 cytochrome c biogenesis protein CcsA [Methylococcales bacterium]